MCSIFWCFFFLTFHNMSTYVYIFLFFSPQVPCNTFGQTKPRCQALASRIFMHSLAESCKLKTYFLWQCWSSQICSSESHSNWVVHTISFANAYEPLRTYAIAWGRLQMATAGKFLWGCLLRVALTLLGALPTLPCTDFASCAIAGTNSSNVSLGPWLKVPITERQQPVRNTKARPNWGQRHPKFRGFRLDSLVCPRFWKTLLCILHDPGLEQSPTGSLQTFGLCWLKLTGWPPSALFLLAS